MTAPPALPIHRPPSLWRNVSFMLMWTSVAASGFGDRLIQLSAWSMLGFHSPDKQAASVQAAVSFFFFIPYVLFGLLAGWLADTLPRKWILLACDETRAVVLLVAMVLAPAGAAMVIPADHHWKIYAIIFAVGTLAAIFSPTKAAIVPQIVPVKDLQAANAIVLGIAVIASLLGFVVGGPMVEKHSVRVALLIGALAYGVSGSFFAFLRITPTVRTAPRRASQIRRLMDAATYTFGHRPILEMTLLTVLFWAAAHVMMAAIAAITKNRYGLALDVAVSRTATMMALLGAGMLLSSVWIVWMNTRRESAWLAMLNLLGAGACMAAFAFNRSYEAGLALAFGTGFFGNTAMICVATLTQSIAPNYMRGRVFGLRDLVNTLSGVIINLVIWRMPNADDWMIPTLAITALVLGAVSLWGLWALTTRGPMSTRTLNVLWRIIRLYLLVWHRACWIGRHHVPNTGPVLLAANHTAGIDPFLIQAAIHRLPRWVMVVNYRFRILEPLWKLINPIDLSLNGGDMAKIRRIIEALRQGECVGIFPEGRLQREVREIQPFQAGIGMIAARTGATIVPIWITGTPKVYSMWGHFLLPSRSVVVFGPPFQPDPHLPPQEIVQELRHRIVALAAVAEQVAR